jgi:hypothetical protein
MKTIMSILLVLVMVFAAVPLCAAGTGAKVNPVANYTCTSVPAYTHYVGVYEVPCPVGANRLVTPEPMGGW